MIVLRRCVRTQVMSVAGAGKRSKEWRPRRTVNELVQKNDVRFEPGEQLAKPVRDPLLKDPVVEIPRDDLHAQQTPGRNRCLTGGKATLQSITTRYPSDHEPSADPGSLVRTLALWMSPGPRTPPAAASAASQLAPPYSCGDGPGLEPVADEPKRGTSGLVVGHAPARRRAIRQEGLSGGTRKRTSPGPRSAST